MTDNIWMCWFQGENAHKPPLNEKCINLWKSLNSDANLKVLSKDTIGDYVPEFFDIIQRSPNRSMQAQSDLLRILLLSKFGGLWVDASVYPMEPFSHFKQHIVNETGFFSYRFTPRGSYDHRKMCETVSWFIYADKPNHYLIESWKNLFVKNFQNFTDWPYFTFHETLTALYDSDEKVKGILDNMIQISEQVPHSALVNWKSRSPSYVYKRPKLDE